MRPAAALMRRPAHPPSAPQALVAAMLTPHPGLAAGVAANTAVFTAGIQVLLKVRRPLWGAAGGITSPQLARARGLAADGSPLTLDRRPLHAHTPSPPPPPPRRLQGLTWEGVLNAWLLGTTVFAAFGRGGYLLVCLYFIFGTLVTKVKLEQKQKEGIAEARSGRRGAVRRRGPAGGGGRCGEGGGVGPGRCRWRWQRGCGSARPVPWSHRRNPLPARPRRPPLGQCVGLRLRRHHLRRAGAGDAQLLPLPGGRERRGVGGR
jgi:hypothetical protein